MVRGVKTRGALKGVAAADRAAAVLTAFRQGDDELSLAEISRRTGLVKSTIMRLAISLESAGLLVRLGEGQYKLGTEIVRLHSIYQASLGLDSILTPALNQLADKTQETAAFYVLKDEQRFCLFRVNSPLALRLDIAPGTYRPLDNASSAQILKLFRNWPEERLPIPPLPLYTAGATNPHTASVSAPVLGAGQRLVGVLSITGPSSRLTEEAASRFKDVLLETAAKVTRALGGELRDLGVEA